jgi:hypothetical protein
MEDLVYPTYPFKIKPVKGKDQLYDPFRQRWVILTPEEWVRQNILQYLVQVCKYPSSMIAVEKTIGQILQYQQVMVAEYLVVSNGHETYGAKIASGKLHSMQNFPDYL